MKKFTVPRRQGQEKVNAYFQSQASFWKNIYSSNDVYAEIHRDRYATVLEWIDRLSLAPGSQVLEIGCGAGFMAVALAKRGFRVHAIDSIETMVEQARRLAVDSAMTDLLSLDMGDACSLAFEDGTFDLVLAIGVIPWLDQPLLAMQEMARVTKPGGYVILTADNRSRLNILLDPWLNPALAPFKRGMKDVLHKVGFRHQSPNEIDSHFHECRFIDKALAEVDLVKTKGMTLGFGPFSLLRRTVIPERLGIALHHRLQEFAEREVPGFRSTGSHYIVLARKSPLYNQQATVPPSLIAQEGYSPEMESS